MPQWTQDAHRRGGGAQLRIGQLFGGEVVSHARRPGLNRTRGSKAALTARLSVGQRGRLRRIKTQRGARVRRGAQQHGLAFGRRGDGADARGIRRPAPPARSGRRPSRPASAAHSVPWPRAAHRPAPPSPARHGPAGRRISRRCAMAGNGSSSMRCTAWPNRPCASAIFSSSGWRAPSSLISAAPWPDAGHHAWQADRPGPPAPARCARSCAGARSRSSGVTSARHSVTAKARLGIDAEGQFGQHAQACHRRRRPAWADRSR